MNCTETEWNFNGKNEHLRDRVYLRNTHHQGSYFEREEKAGLKIKIGGTSSLGEVRLWECVRGRWRGSRGVKEGEKLITK